jgi:asparagine synthase (glutamine-hydrolysing)
MCGICGIVYPQPSRPMNERQLLQMRDVLAHRGPDDAGNFFDGGVALGSRRLAILDLSPKGHMPMTTAEERYHIVYNGEIYNYRALRSSLEAKGYVFRSGTDTEVLLRLYEAFGPAMLERLNGMFAFAIWDRDTRELFVARDRLGVKPFYYAEYGGGFYFASEEKALFAAGVPASFDWDVCEELLCFRYVAGERTPYVGVKRLLPGHSLAWRDGRVRIRRWWNLAERARALRGATPSDPVEWFQHTLDSSIDLRRISDVPVGVLLSGGLDSGTVAAALALQAGEGVHSFTVRFQERGFDEGGLAQGMAERWHLQWHQLTVQPDYLRECLGTASWLNDEPLAHGNDVHLWAIAKYAKPRVTVLLSGEGADETLGGYVRYKPLRHPALLKRVRAVLPWVPAGIAREGRVRKLSRFLGLRSIRDFVLFNACNTLPSDLQLLGLAPVARFAFRERIIDEAEALYPNEPMRQAMYSDQHTFLCSLLDRNDRMTMGASIECRVPFLDYRLVEGLSALPSSMLYVGRQPKGLLRQSVGSRLTKPVLRHDKWGFGVPWRRYLRELPAFRGLVEALPSHDLVREGLFRPASVATLVRRFLGGEDALEPLIKQLIAVTVWHDSCFRSTSAQRESKSVAVN